MNKANILVTGGLGYIGSHTSVELINNGYNVTIVDSLINSEKFILERIEKITGEKFPFYQFDITNYKKTSECFKENNFDFVIHFAALKSVNESVKYPEKYMKNNLDSLKNILKCIESQNLSGIVFSSSCTVYGQPDNLPVNENSPFKKPESPYAETKQICEKLIEKFSEEKRKNGIRINLFNISLSPTNYFVR